MYQVAVDQPQQTEHQQQQKRQNNSQMSPADEFPIKLRLNKHWTLQLHQADRLGYTVFLRINEKEFMHQSKR